MAIESLWAVVRGDVVVDNGSPDREAAERSRDQYAATWPEPTYEVVEYVPAAEASSWRRVAERCESERQALREALIEVASAVDEIPNVLFGQEDNDWATRAMGWAQRAAGTADAALTAGHNQEPTDAC